MKIVSYNVDGLPESLDLMTLPIWLRWIGWIYSKIKGTSIVTINDGSDKESSFNGISSYLSSLNADIVVVQEHFNYPITLEGYNEGTFTGGFELSSTPKNITLFPPRFKCDGLQIFTKYNIVSEDIVSWNKSYGYFSHANDKLTHKGFRYYRLDTGRNREIRYIDVYNVHMDADFYHPGGDVKGDIEARRSQVRQLIEYVNSHSKDAPLVIVGDTNCYSKYEWDEEIIGELIEGVKCHEVVPTNHKDCDRIFVRDIYWDGKNKAEFDTDIKYSDHKPLIAEI